MGVFVGTDVRPCSGVARIPDVPAQNPAQVRGSSTVHCVNNGGGRERRCARERCGRPGDQLDSSTQPCTTGGKSCPRASVSLTGQFPWRALMRLKA